MFRLTPVDLFLCLALTSIAIAGFAIALNQLDQRLTNRSLREYINRVNCRLTEHQQSPHPPPVRHTPTRQLPTIHSKERQP